MIMLTQMLENITFVSSDINKIKLTPASFNILMEEYILSKKSNLIMFPLSAFTQNVISPLGSTA